MGITPDMEIAAVAIALVAYAGYREWLRHQRRTLIHRERLAAIEKGIELPLEQRFNPWVKQGMGFHYFFSRKFMLDYSAMAYVYFPGGYGTLDELFTVLTLIQTGKTDRGVPVILMGEDYWKPLTDWIIAQLLGRRLIAPTDIDIWHCTDDIEEAVRIIRHAGERVDGGG